MTKTQGPVVRSIPDSRPGHDASEQPGSNQAAKICGLSDRQAVIAAMVANGANCKDIAFELFLPLRTVQGHLALAMRILGLSRVEDLTYSAIAAHQTRNLEAAATRSKDLPLAQPIRATGGDESSNSLVALDAAEAVADASPDQESTQVADLILELAAMRTQLHEQHLKVQQLTEAVDSRDSIGQAKGILMERHRISAAAAFTLLQRESSRSSRRLADVAKDLVLSGEEAPERST